jgi:hypothetical protein
MRLWRRSIISTGEMTFLYQARARLRVSGGVALAAAAKAASEAVETAVSDAAAAPVKPPAALHSNRSIVPAMGS